MIKKLKNTVLALATLSCLVVPVLATSAAASADTTAIKNGLCSGVGLNLSGGGTDCSSGANTDSFNALLTKIINIFSAIVGVIAVIMIIVGGLRYITSGGDSQHVSTAKNTIIYALVGLVVVALAQLIVHFVLNQAQTVTQ